MKLLVVSHTPHYQRRGEIVGWGPTVREIDRLATLFDSVVHLAPLHREPATSAALPYRSPRVTLRPVRSSGGPTLGKKLSVLAGAPGVLRALRRELRDADAVHVRSPANISLLTLVYLAIADRRPCWAKYAGNWKPDGSDPWSYRVQRRLLQRGWSGLAVTVNGRFEDQPPHVRSFLNPCLTRKELTAARALAAEKELSVPLRLLFAGQLHEAKGGDRAIEILSRLMELDIDARLDLVGDGPARSRCERLAKDLGVGPSVRFAGWIPRPALAEFYAQAHFLLLPSVSSEGWPKVLGEAMAYGAVPIAGAISSIPQVLAEAGSGRALAPLDTAAACAAIREYVEQPERWRTESRRGAEHASRFSYDSHVDAVRALFRDCWGITLRTNR